MEFKSKSNYGWLVHHKFKILCLNYGPVLNPLMIVTLNYRRPHAYQMPLMRFGIVRIQSLIQWRGREKKVIKMELKQICPVTTQHHLSSVHTLMGGSEAFNSAIALNTLEYVVKGSLLRFTSVNLPLSSTITFFVSKKQCSINYNLS